MRLGQHFLMDRGATMRIASYADLRPQDNVLEIGSGLGNLTEALAARAGRIYAVEIDPDLAAQLSGRFVNVQVIKSDVLKVELPLTIRSSPTCPIRSPPGSPTVCSPGPLRRQF